MSAALEHPAAGTRPVAGDEPAALTVAWVGDEPWWLADEGARRELAHVTFRPLDSSDLAPVVIHACGDALHALDGRPRGAHEQLVVDLSCVERLGRAARRIARGADVVLADYRHASLIGHGATWPRVAFVRPPVDLWANAPATALHERDRDLKRLRRLHRLTPSTLLYAGPYTEGGGLHRLLDAAATLRADREDLVIAAIPWGRVDRHYRDACDRRALAFGHRGIVEWSVEPGVGPLWFALAAVVCLPCTEPVDPLPALLAAAAARPFVGGSTDTLRAEVVDGRTGYLVDATDVDELAARIDSLLVDSETATEMGNEARRRAERELSPVAAARRLRSVWTDVWPGACEEMSQVP